MCVFSISTISLGEQKRKKKPTGFDCNQVLVPLLRNELSGTLLGLLSSALLQVLCVGSSCSSLFAVYYIPQRLP